MLLIILIAIELPSQAQNYFELNSYPLKSIEEFCQIDSQRLISKTNYSYNEKHQLIEAVKIWNRKALVKSYEYEDNGLLKSMKWSNSGNVLLKTRKRDNQSRLIYELKTNRSRIKEILFFYDEELGKFTGRTIKYENRKREFKFNDEYDENGQLTKKYINNNLVSIYEYEKGVLIRKIITKGTRKELRYVYEEKHCIKILSDKGELIEEREIYRDRVIKKWEYDYSKIPCGLCCKKKYYEYDYY